MVQAKHRMSCHLSDLADAEAASQEAISRVAAEMRGSTDLAVVFFSGHHLPASDLILSTVHDLLAPAVVIGCSGISVSGNDAELENAPGLAVMAASWPGVQMQTFTDAHLDWPKSAEDPSRLCEAMGADRPDLRGVLLLADPYTPVVTLLPALSETLQRSPDKPSIPLFGGVASAGRQPGDNRLFRNDSIRNGGIVGLSIFGPIRIDTLVSQGCRPIGRPMVVTGAKRNILESLGGQPAMAAFHELVEGLSESERLMIQEKGLFVGRAVNEYRDRFGRGDFLIRNVIGVDRGRGLLAVSDLVKVGQTVQFHVRDAQSAHDDLELLLAAQQFDDSPLGGLLFTCNGRGTNLFNEPHHDVRTIRRALPHLPLAGFAAAGEIGPVGNGAYLHGHTASLALFREA